MKLRFLITTFFILSLALPGFTLTQTNNAETDTLTFDRGQEQLYIKKQNPELIEAYQSQSEFLYDRVPPKPESFWARIRQWLWLKFIYLLSHATPALFLRYILVGGLLLFFLSRLLKSPMVSLFRPAKSVTSIQFQENEDPTQIDWAKLILEAIKAGNYQTAVRYLFLQTLKNLSEQELIQWKSKKTNLDYYREIHSEELKIAFREIAKLYEAVWYGDFSIGEEDFLLINGDFQKFNETLNESVTP